MRYLIVALIMVIGFIGCSDKKQNDKLSDKEILSRIKNSDDFDKHKDKYLHKTKELLAKKECGEEEIFLVKWEKVADMLDYYVLRCDSGNKYLKITSDNDNFHIQEEKIKIIPNTSFSENEKKDKATGILKKLKKIPLKDVEKNKNLYQQLVNLYPNNQKYIDKLKYYNRKFTKLKQKEYIKKRRNQEEFEKTQKEQKIKMAIFGEKPSSGEAYVAVRRYLRDTAHDPSSIDMGECTPVYEGKNGWLIACDYRGRNAFGGLVKNAHWFTILRSQVVKMESIDTYKIN